MEHKVSKAQLEVWEWKEKAYEEIKDLPLGERINYIQKKGQALMDKYFPDNNIVAEPPAEYLPDRQAGKTKKNY